MTHARAWRILYATIQNADFPDGFTAAQPSPKEIIAAWQSPDEPYHLPLTMHVTPSMLTIFVASQIPWLVAAGQSDTPVYIPVQKAIDILAACQRHQ